MFLYNVKMTTNIITHEIQDDLGYPILKQAYSVSEVIVPILVQLFSEIDGTAVNLFVWTAYEQTLPGKWKSGQDANINLCADMFSQQKWIQHQNRS